MSNQTLFGKIHAKTLPIVYSNLVQHAMPPYWACQSLKTRPQPACTRDLSAFQSIQSFTAAQAALRYNLGLND